MKFDMGAAWQDATTMISRNKEVLLVVAGIFFFLPALVQALLIPGMDQLFTDTTDPETMQAQVLALYTDWGWLFILTGLLSIVGYLALLSLLRDASRPTVGDAIKGGFIGLLPAIGTYILFVLLISLIAGLAIGAGAGSGSVAVGIVFGLVAFIAVVYISVKTSLAAPVVALDREYNPIKVFARSWKLTKGNSLRIFLFFFLIMLVYFVISLIVGMIAALVLAALGNTVGLVVAGLLSAFIGTAVAIVLVAVLAAMHRQLAGPSAESVSETFD